jgi:hypothetical protein
MSTKLRPGKSYTLYTPLTLTQEEEHYASFVGQTFVAKMVDNKGVVLNQRILVVNNLVGRLSYSNVVPYCCYDLTNNEYYRWQVHSSVLNELFRKKKATNLQISYSYEYELLDPTWNPKFPR